MANKVGIGIEAQLDTSAVEQRINAFGQRVAQSNKAQFTPITPKSLDDINTAIKRFEQLLKVHGELNRRVKATGQTGKAPWELDFESMFPGGKARSQNMRKVFEYAFPQHSMQNTPNQPGGGGGFGAMAGRVAQAGLRGAGPVGGVAANALGTGMSAGAGAGLMGLMGGMLALGVGKIVGAAAEKITAAEENNIALDRLKRNLGDVNVSFNALKAVVHGSADNLKITYSEAGQLASQFVKLGNVTGDQYKTIHEELGVGVGMSRAFGMDPSQGVGVMGQMRGLGVTSNSQDSRRFALLIGETIGKSGAFAKADEVMDALAGYTTSQTRSNMSAANTGGYAGMFAGMVGSGIAGMDPAGAAAMLSRVNASLAAGGAKGEASQFLTARVGQRLGLDPMQTQIFREGGMFATKRESFGEGSAYSRYMGGAMAMGKDADTTHFHARMAELKRDPSYANNPLMLAQAMANDTGLNMRQAMTLMDIKPERMGEMSKYADVGKLSGNGIGNLSKALYGSADDRRSLAGEYWYRKGDDAISKEDREALRGAAGDDGKLRSVLAEMAPRYDQEKTLGSDIRDSKAILDNIKTNMADKLVPMVNEMRHGIMYMSGAKDGKSPREIMEAVLEAEKKDKLKTASAEHGAEPAKTQRNLDAIKAEKEKITLESRKQYGKFTTNPEEYHRQMKELSELEVRATEANNKAKEKYTEAMKKVTQELDDGITDAKNGLVPGTTNAARNGGSRSESPFPAGGGHWSINPANAVRSTGGGAPGDYDHLFNKYGQQYGVDPRLLKAIANKESSMRAGAVSPVNSNGTQDFGLMQHNSRYLSSRGLTKDWDNPERSVEEAAKLLSSNIKRGGSVRAGVRMYNGSGPRAEAYADDIMGRVGNTRIDAAAVAPAGAGRGGPSFRVSADDITVRVVDANGMPRQAPQTIATRIQQAVPFGTAISN